MFLGLRITEYTQSRFGDTLRNKRGDSIAHLPALRVIATKKDEIILERLQPRSFANGYDPIIKWVCKHSRARMKQPGRDRQRLSTGLKPSISAAIPLFRL